MISLKVDGYMEFEWGFAFVPIWCVCAVLLMFSCFMCPGFMDAKIKMQRQAYLMFVYVLSVTTMSVIIAVRLVGGISGSWAVLLIPVWLTLGTHILSLGIVACKHRQFPAKEATSVSLILVTAILLMLHLDNYSIPWASVFIPIWFILGYELSGFVYFKLKEETEEGEPLVK